MTSPVRLPAPRPARPCVEPPFRGRVLVLAPHPDDESIGPGATLAKHARLGDGVTAVFVTSGVNGDARREMEPDAYVALRRAEAERAAAVLGIGATEFWEFPDGCEVTEDDLRAVVERLAGVLDRVRPDVIYAPHPGETHSDHHFVALAAERARDASGRPARILGYEIWEALAPDFVVDVADTYAAKLEAVRCYASQLEDTDIVRAVDGLNRFRSVLLPGRGEYAEAFVDGGDGS